MKVLYVDDEALALQNFKLTVQSFEEIDNLALFQIGKEAVKYISENPVDVAFLDVEMHGENGIDIARQIKKINDDILIVFVTAYKEYALDAFGVDAIGYVMKPYLKEDIKKTLNKVSRYLPNRGFLNNSNNNNSKRVVVQTIPTFSVTIDGKPFHIGREKVLELFALLIENKDRGITTGEGIACLWPDRPNDTNTQSLFRMTYKRLIDALEEAGVDDIVESKNNRRYVNPDKIECDLYDILSGDVEAAQKYCGRYLSEYSWAEERNGELIRILFDSLY